MVLQVAPDPGAGPARTSSPASRSSSAGPTPDSRSNFGELMAEAARITSRRARTISTPPLRSTSTPTARRPSNTTLWAKERTRVEVGALQRGFEVGVGGRPAAALPHRLLHGAEALLLAAVVVPGGLEAGLPAGLDEGVIERVLPPTAGDVERPVRPPPAHLAFVARLQAQKIGHHVGVGPAVGALIGPMVVVARMAAHVDHAVDGARPADDLAARAGQLPPAEMRLRLGPIAPVVTAHVHGNAERRRHLDQRARVGPAELHHQDRVVAVLREPRGHGRPGRARADDHEIRLHGPFLTPRWPRDPSRSART